ncbi:MAG TPA: GAF domain-containing protein [Terriglobales bacterium]|nr:GAF domain-containing protein [Terriglobales bacterium]
MPRVNKEISGNFIANAMANDCKILVIEPDHDAVLRMASAFRQQGWSVISASDAVLGQSLVRKENPSGIILGGKLPAGGTAVAIRRIRSSIYGAGIPIVVAAKDNAQKGELLAAGANEFIDNLDAQAVCATLRKHIFGMAGPAKLNAPAEIIASPQRISALAAAEVLDTPNDWLLDQITQITAALLGTPVALLSIVDKDRQFFKSQFGLPEPWATSRQTPLSHSFCQWVIVDKDELVVDDARAHPLLRSNLAIRDLGLVSYAGIPVLGDEGEPIGSFCAMDSQPHPWKQQQLATLRDLAHMAEAGLLLTKKTRDRNADTGLMAILLEHGAQILRREKSKSNTEGWTLLLDLIENQARELSSEALRTSGVHA